MNTFTRLSVLSLTVLLPAAVPGQASDKPAVPTRVALVSGEKAEAIRNVLTLAEVKLSQVSGLQLLERQAIDRVLAEQKLTLSGLVAADQALAVGKVLPVDLFAVLEAGLDRKEAAGLVVFDAHTGVRLHDAALPADALDRTVASLANALQAARQKRRAVAKLRPVCLLTVRNADLPRDLDAFCDSVGLLLERQLVASPDLAVLERRRLEQVNRERELPLDSPLRQLLASVVTVELEVGTAWDGRGLRATALLSDSRGQALDKARAEVASRDVAALARALFKDTARVLNARVALVEGGRDREAGRFLREAEFFWGHKDYHRALRAAESACALRPEEPTLRVALRGLLQRATDLIRPADPKRPPWLGRPLDPETLALSLQLARRGSDQLLQAEAANAPRLYLFGSLHQAEADNALRNYLPTLGTCIGEVTEASRAGIDAVRSNHRRLLETRIDRDRAGVRDKPSFDRYTDQVCASLWAEGGRLAAPAQWVDGLCRLRTWAEVAQRHEDVRAASSQAVLDAALSTYQHLSSPEEADVARLQRLWADLEGHPNATIAVYGRLGGAVNAVRFGKLPNAEQLRQVHDFRLFVQGLLEKEDGEPGALRVNLYQLATAGLAHHLRPPRSAGLSQQGDEELKELCDFMLGRKELFPALAEFTAVRFSFRRAPEGYRHAASILERALALLNADETFLSAAATPVLLGQERDRYRDDYRRLQAELYRAHPDLSPNADAPWEKVTTLIDVHSNREGIVWLQRPVVYEGSVYAAAVRVDGDPARPAVQLLRFTPGAEARWEGRPVEVALPFRPWVKIGRTEVRRSLAFGTAACIHRGRYYLGTKEHGIFVFPLDGGPPERINVADGLPSNAVQALAFLDGRLLAYLGEPGKESYLVAWDGQTRTCAVLSSSRRKEKRSPFDDTTPLVASALVPDPARGQLLLAVFSSTQKQGLDGVWALDARSGTFSRLLALNSLDRVICGPRSRVEGDRLLLNGAYGQFTYDLAKKEQLVVFDGKVSLEVGPFRSGVRQLAALPGYRLAPDEFLNVQPPHLLVDGWLWGAWPLSRRKLAEGKREHLPPLRPGDKFFQPTQCLQTFRGDREVLVGDSFGLWLVTLRNK